MRAECTQLVFARAVPNLWHKSLILKNDASYNVLFTKVLLFIVLIFKVTYTIAVWWRSMSSGGRLSADDRCLKAT